MPEKLKAATFDRQTTTADLGRLQQIQTQREWIRRLDQDAEEKAAILKQAKLRAESALDDLKRMCDPSQPQQGDLFAGRLLTDPTTGSIRAYQSISDIERELQEEEDAKRRERERKLRSTEKPG